MREDCLLREECLFSQLNQEDYLLFEKIICCPRVNVCFIMASWGSTWSQGTPALSPPNQFAQASQLIQLWQCHFNAPSTHGAPTIYGRLSQHGVGVALRSVCEPGWPRALECTPRRPLSHENLVWHCVTA